MRRHDARFLTAAALLSLLCAASCLPRWMSGRPRDAGGVYLLVAVRAEPAALEESIRQASRVIEARCNAIPVHCEIEREGDAGSGLVKLRVSGAKDFARVKAVLLAEGRLELRAVVSPSSPMPIQTYRTRAEAEAAARAGNHDVVPYEEDGVEAGFLLVEREPVVTGRDLSDARATALRGDGSVGDYSVAFTLKPEAAGRFGAWTSANINRYLAIVLNGRARSAPYIRSRITDSGQITGSFTKQSAEDIALTLRSGNLPVRLELLEEGTYKP